MDSQLHQVDIGHVVVADADLGSMDNPTFPHGQASTKDMQSYIGNDGVIATQDGTESLASNDSSDADGDTRHTTATGTITSTNSSNAGGLFYSGSNHGKSPGNRSTGAGGVLFGKSSSLIFPTGVEQQQQQPPDAGSASNSTAAGSISVKRTKINFLLDQCETVRFPFKKKLVLSSLGLNASDIPVKDLYGTNLGNTLQKLCLDGNRLSTIPPKLVTCLPALKTLDLSQCELHQLPERWNLPQLKRLNLSHNRLTDFPEEVRIFVLLQTGFVWDTAVATVTQREEKYTCPTLCVCLATVCHLTRIIVIFHFLSLVEHVGGYIRALGFEHVWQQSERHCCPS